MQIQRSGGIGNIASFLLENHLILAQSQTPGYKQPAWVERYNQEGESVKNMFGKTPYPTDEEMIKPGTPEYQKYDSYKAKSNYWTEIAGEAIQDLRTLLPMYGKILYKVTQGNVAEPFYNIFQSAVNDFNQAVSSNTISTEASRSMLYQLRNLIAGCTYILDDPSNAQMKAAITPQDQQAIQEVVALATKVQQEITNLTKYHRSTSMPNQRHGPTIPGWDLGKARDNYGNAQQMGIDRFHIGW
jgi:hypothetical protein